MEGGRKETIFGGVAGNAARTRRLIGAAGRSRAVPPEPAARGDPRGVGPVEQPGPGQSGGRRAAAGMLWLLLLERGGAASAQPGAAGVRA